MWEKEWFQFPKGPGENEQNVRIVVAKAQDIDGRPLAGETVSTTHSRKPGSTSSATPPMKITWKIPMVCWARGATSTWAAAMRGIRPTKAPITSV